MIARADEHSDNFGHPTVRLINIEAHPRTALWHQAIIISKYSQF